MPSSLDDLDAAFNDQVSLTGADKEFLRLATQEDTPITSSRTEVAAFVARATTKAVMACVVLFLAGAVQALRHGSISAYFVIIAGSVLAVVALLAYPMQILSDAGKKRRGLAPMLVAFGGFIPYLFGCYLVFYEGFWRLRHLRDDFSIATIVLAAVFIVLGYSIVLAIYRLSELGRQVDDGKIVIKQGEDD